VRRFEPLGPILAENEQRASYTRAGSAGTDNCLGECVRRHRKLIARRRRSQRLCL